MPIALASLFFLPLTFAFFPPQFFYHCWNFTHTSSLVSFAVKAAENISDTAGKLYFLHHLCLSG
jgi:hypothetical protein